MTNDMLARVSVESVARIAFNGGEMPNGHLYAHTMTRGCTLEDHNLIVRVLEERGFITDNSYLLSLTEKGKTFATLIMKSLEKA